jgi:hypothetical protein
MPKLINKLKETYIFGSYENCVKNYKLVFMRKRDYRVHVGNTSVKR